MSNENETSMPVATGTTNTTPDSIQVVTVKRLGKPWHASTALLPFLGELENGTMNGTNFARQKVEDGFILTVYNDSKKLPTVGCGHLVTAADKLKTGEKITKDQAKEFLKSDLKSAEMAVNNLVDVPLYQYEYDALVSFTFNAGAHGAKPLLKVVNGGKYEELPSVIPKAKQKGNEWRRALEANLFKTGVYDATH
jgi:lysozyme